MLQIENESFAIQMKPENNNKKLLKMTISLKKSYSIHKDALKILITQLRIL